MCLRDRQTDRRTGREGGRDAKSVSYSGSYDLMRVVECIYYTLPNPDLAAVTLELYTLILFITSRHRGSHFNAGESTKRSRSVVFVRWGND